MDFAYCRRDDGQHPGFPPRSQKHRKSNLMTATDDAKAIESVIQSYLDGLHEGDAGKIASAFHPTSALTSISEAGELAITPPDVWLNNARNRPSPKQPGLPHHDQVLPIDLIGPT